MKAPTTDATLAEQIETLEQQVDELVLERFTHDDAWAIGSWLWRTAIERSHGVTIDVRRGDQQLFHAARPGTSADNDNWIERKIRVARRFGTASYLVGRRLEAYGVTIDVFGLDPMTHAAAGGCVPVSIAGVGMVGTVTVSGLDDASDHALVVEALRLLQAGDLS